MLSFLQVHEYHLGNGFKTTSPEIAMNAFMKREFEEILNVSESPHDAIFVPDAFQYGPTAVKVLILNKKNIICEPQLFHNLGNVIFL